MSRKRHSTEQIISKLREAEIELGKGARSAKFQAARHHRSDVLPMAQGVRRSSDRPGIVRLYVLEEDDDKAKRMRKEVMDW